MSVLLEAEGVVKRYPWRGSGAPWRRSAVTALAGVSFELRRGECLGIVGESGSGKTTLARCLVRLIEPEEGRVQFDGVDWLALGGRALRRRRRELQLVFQDPLAALDARMRVRALVAEPLVIHRLVPSSRLGSRVSELLADVGLSTAAVGERYPHELSGGQRQRVAIARALACGPRLLIADEPVSALDVSIQAQILELFQGLGRGGLAMIFISHDLAVVERVADRVLVLYLGRVVESATRRSLYSRPQHPYTAGLLRAVAVSDQGRAVPPLTGDVPSPLDPPPGCPFHPRCPIARPRCVRERPELKEQLPGHAVACHYPGTTDAAPGELLAQGYVGPNEPEGSPATGIESRPD